MGKLRMGVLGCSGHYALRVATPLKYSLLVEPYGVASRDAEKARKFAETWGFRVSYGSYEELLADPSVDFVYNPLPNHLHLDYIRKAADAGKPILCEKPLCLNAKEAAEAANYCKERNVPLMEAFMYRFHPQWLRAVEVVKSGELGTIMSTQTIFTYNNKDGANIRNKAEYGGGGLLDIGCYAVSTSRLLMGGEPEKAAAALVWDPVFKSDIFSSGILVYGKGRTSAFTVSTQMFPCQRVTAYGTNGNISVEIPFNMPADIPGKLTITTGVAKREVETLAADQYLLEFDAFAKALDKSKTGAVNVPTPVSDAVANMAVLDALFASASSGNWETVAAY
jgi:predicted dehydrogenase